MWPIQFPQTLDLNFPAPSGEKRREVWPVRDIKLEDVIYGYSILLLIIGVFYRREWFGFGFWEEDSLWSLRFPRWRKRLLIFSSS